MAKKNNHTLILVLTISCVLAGCSGVTVSEQQSLKQPLASETGCPEPCEDTDRYIPMEYSPEQTGGSRFANEFAAAILQGVFEGIIEGIFRALLYR